MRPPILLALFAVTLGACTDNPTSPIASTIITGDFGGPNARLHADSASATIQLPCASIDIAQPLQTDANGQFLASGVERSSAGPVPINPPPGSPVTVTGLAITDGVRRIRLIVRPLVIDPPIPPGDTLFVTEGIPGNFPECLAAQ